MLDGVVSRAGRAESRTVRGGTLDMQCQKHIVVVDDEPGIRETTQEYLELPAFRVTAAGGGEELRRAHEAEDVDLLLLDICKPGADGHSLSRSLAPRHQVHLHPTKERHTTH